MALHLTMKVAVTAVRPGCFLIHLDLFFYLFISFLFWCVTNIASLNLAAVRFNLKGHFIHMLFLGKLTLCMAKGSPSA